MTNKWNAGSQLSELSTAFQSHLQPLMSLNQVNFHIQQIYSTSILCLKGFSALQSKSFQPSEPHLRSTILSCSSESSWWNSLSASPSSTHWGFGETHDKHASFLWLTWNQSKYKVIFYSYSYIQQIFIKLLIFARHCKALELQQWTKYAHISPH